MNRKIFRFQYILLLSFLFLAPSRVLAWEERDKDAFLQKINIIKALIDEQQERLNKNLSLKQMRTEARQFCLLQSIGVDVLHRYIEMNPNDAEWRSYYNVIRDRMSSCLFVMYQLEEKLQ